MKIYLVWEDELLGYERVIKVYKNEDKAKSFIKHRDKMTGCRYHIEEMEMEDLYDKENKNSFEKDGQR